MTRIGSLIVKALMCGKAFVYLCPAHDAGLLRQSFFSVELATLIVIKSEGAKAAV